MPAEGQQQRPTVFISYAHESDVLRASVKALADWLGNQGCTVLTDHPYMHRPPERGWQVWMHDCVRKADVVLVVCTPKLKARYEKNEEPGTGFGATFEGAIVTQHIYDAAMRNTKFFPVIPDAGSYDDVPTTLRPWWNRHSFPSGNEGIRRMIEECSGRTPPSEDTSRRIETADGQGTPQNAPLPTPAERVVDMTSWPAVASLKEQVREAATRLGKPAAELFFQALQTDVEHELGWSPVPASPEDMVRSFTEHPDTEVSNLFFSIRRALRVLEDVPDISDPRVRAGEEAAAALYCLIACRLVDRSVRTEGDYMLAVPVSEPLVCAVIATALFGGKLELKSAETGQPHPRYVFRVHVPAAGEEPLETFERAVYVALFPDALETAEHIAPGSGELTQEQQERLTEAIRMLGPLNEDERETLAEEFDHIRNVPKNSFALVVHGLVARDAGRRFAQSYKAPVLVPDSTVTEVLLGMKPERLKASIAKFWSSLRALRHADSRPHAISQPAPPQRPKGEPAMSARHVNVSVTGNGANITFTQGADSAAQSGAGNTANIGHRESADLIAVLQQLAQVIDAHASTDTRASLVGHANEAAAAAQQAAPDRVKIQNRLDTIDKAVKQGAAIGESGEKIATLLHGTYQMLASMFGS